MVGPMTENERELADVLKWVAFPGWMRCEGCGAARNRGGASSSSRDKAVEILDRIEPGWRESYLDPMPAKCCPCTDPDEGYGA